MSSVSKKIRFGLIGCGQISSRHIKSIKVLKNAQLVTVCDLVEQRAKQYNVDWTTNYHNLIKRDDLDVISVCTPNGLHTQMGIDIARAGKHCLMEKPLGLNLKDADRLINAFKKSGKKLFAVKQVRFNPTVLALKDAVSNKKLGKINNAALVVRWCRPQEYYDRDAWRGTRKLDGGALLNQGIHYIDILQWILGPVVSVYAKIDTIGHKIEIEDIALAILKFKSGAYATVEFTLSTYPCNLECSLTVLGKQGTLKLGGPAMDSIEIWQVANCPKPLIKNVLAPNVYAGGLYQGSCPNHIFVYQNIVNHLRKGEKILTDGYEARKSLEIVEAVYRSAKQNKEIKLPL